MIRLAHTPPLEPPEPHRDEAALTDLELMRIHVETLFTHDRKGRMRRVNEPGGGAAPRFFFGQAVQGSVLRFRWDVDDAVVQKLSALCKAIGERRYSPHGLLAFEALLGLSTIERRYTGPAYRFPDQLSPHPDTVHVTAENADLLRPHLAEWMKDVRPHQPMLAVVRDGDAVAVCCSVRISPEAHEAGVETAWKFRGRGCAARVVAAWAAAVRGMGCIPLYSTSWENGASQAVARKLGLRQFGADLHLT